MTEKIHSLIFVVADNIEVSTLLREDTDYFLYSSFICNKIHLKYNSWFF